MVQLSARRSVFRGSRRGAGQIAATDRLAFVAHPAITIPSLLCCGPKPKEECLRRLPASARSRLGESLTRVRRHPPSKRRRAAYFDRTAIVAPLRGWSTNQANLRRSTPAEPAAWPWRKIYHRSRPVEAVSFRPSVLLHRRPVTRRRAAGLCIRPANPLIWRFPDAAAMSGRLVGGGGDAELRLCRCPREVW